MKGLRVFGDYVFEYVIITLMFIISAALVIPLVPLYVGLCEYFSRDINSRLFKDIFTPLKKNFKIVLQYTILETLLLAISALNIIFFTTGDNIVGIIISFIALFVGIMIFIHAPFIILGMNVNLIQLLFNSVALMLGGITRSVIMIIAVVATGLIGAQISVAVIALLYPLVILNVKLIKPNFNVLKAKALNISLEELKQQQQNMEE